MRKDKCSRCRSPCNVGNSWCEECHKIICEAMHNRPPCGCKMPMDRLVVIHHLGFLCILETPEQLARLRNEPIQLASSVASSKISRCNLAEIKPIDKTAAVVAAKKSA